LIQSLARSLFLLRRLIINILFINIYIPEVISLALLTKLGLFPIYFWFPDVREGISWIRFTILRTWQKLIPFYLLRNLIRNIIYISIFFSSWIGCLGIINLTSIRKLLAYSSINNIAWILFSLPILRINWVLFFTIYSMIIIFIIFICKNNNYSSLAQIINNLNFNTKQRILFTLLSLGGIPPLLGFIPKWLIINNTPETILILVIILVITSLFSILIYLRFMFPTLIISSTPKIQKILIEPLIVIPFNIIILRLRIPLLLL